MDISQQRPDFTIFVVDADYPSAQSLAGLLKASGYADVQFYPTLEAALAMARENPPHVVLFDFERQEAAAEPFLVEMQSISPEIQSILMIDFKQTLSALQLVGRHLAYDTITRPFVSTLEIVQKIDRALVRLYFQFATEQLAEQVEDLQKKEIEFREVKGDLPLSTPSVSEPAPLSGSAQSSPAAGVPLAAKDDRALGEYLGRLAGIKDLEQTIQAFMDTASRELGNSPVLYFKYMASHVSLLVSQAAWLPIEKFRGVGVDLRKQDPLALPGLFRDPNRIEPLCSMLKSVFRTEQFSAFAHQNEGETLGLFVFLGTNEGAHDAPKVVVLRRAFELAFKRNLTLKEKHAFDVLDNLTGVFNRKHFAGRLDEEISRSRRILLPVSLVTLDVDGIGRLNDRLGFQQTDSILRAVAQILRKTARANDIVARIGPDEFVCLLPHTGHMGAAVKAERVRRLIESTRFPLLESNSLGPLTVSLGVSEYPSFSNDAEGLLQTSHEALEQVRRAGGNKVCLSTPPPGFQMDFAPRDSSSGPAIRGARSSSATGTLGAAGANGSATSPEGVDG